MSQPVFPRYPLIGAGVLIAVTIVTVAAIRLTGSGTEVPTSVALQSREFRFQDRTDGSIAVLDGGGEAMAATIPPGGGYFLRGTLRTLATERKNRGLGPDIPFRLTRWADGRLTLLDEADGRSIELESFGATNEASFARLLEAPKA